MNYTNRYKIGQIIQLGNDTFKVFSVGDTGIFLHYETSKAENTNIESHTSSASQWVAGLLPDRTKKRGYTNV